MGSAFLTLMLFVGIMLVLRSLILGVIPYFLERKRKKDQETGPGTETEEKE